MIIKHPPNYFQASIAGLESSLLLQSEEKKNLESSSKSLSDPQKSLKKLEQLSWNVDRTGEVGKWNIARATNFQVDSEKHPYLNAALRGVNNTTGFVACIENLATNSAGTILFDIPAAIEDLSVKHGGPSFQELAVSMEAVTPGIPDEVVPYVLGRLSRIGQKPLIAEKAVVQSISEELPLFATRLEKVPHGFNNEQEFRQFGEEVRKGLQAVGGEDGEVFIRGSSVTGVSYDPPHLPFDVSRRSDFDLAVVSSKLLEKAKRMRIYTRNRGERTVKLSDTSLRKLGLRSLVKELSQKMKRDVTLMIYSSEERIAVRDGTYVKFPSGEK